MKLLVHQSVAPTIEALAGRSGGTVLLHGPAGVGKRTVGLEIARRLNCKGCDNESCHSCSMLCAGHHPDVVVVAPDDKHKIGIEAVHELRHQFVYGSYETGSHRLALIVQADRLTLPAQHALLKTLEEPPSATTVILTATGTTSLLDTIVSRCRPIYLPPLAPAIISQHLQQHVDLSAESATAMARLSGGAIGRAMRYAAEPALLKHYQEVEQQVVALTSAAQPFERLVAATVMARQADRILEYVEGLTAWARSSSRQQADRALNLAAVERLRRRLSANVNAKAAFEALALELAC
jgi:DNA polymerase III delta prime subunit